MSLEDWPRLPAARSRLKKAGLFLAALLFVAALAGCAGSVEAPVRAEAPGEAGARNDAAAALRGRGPATPLPVTPSSVTADALAAAGVLPRTPASPEPGPTPSPAAAPCQSAAGDGKAATAVYISEDDGYCLRYPAEMKPVVGGGQAHTVVFNGPGRETGAQEVQVSLLVEVQPAAGETLEQILAGVLASYSPDVAQGAVRQDTRIGGQPAVVMEGLSGQLPNRQAFVISNDRLYHLVLSPYREPTMAALQPEAEAAWAAATDSMTFLP